MRTRMRKILRRRLAILAAGRPVRRPVVDGIGDFSSLEIRLGAGGYEDGVPLEALLPLLEQHRQRRALPVPSEPREELMRA